MPHTPVLLDETIRLLDPRPGDCIVDGTLGSGGHARALLEGLHGSGTLLALDGDRRALEGTAEALRGFGAGAQLIAECANFADLSEVLARHALRSPDGILLDLGFSSDQLAAGQGLSFLSDESLDMRYGVFAGERTAADIVNRSSAGELETLIREHGGERYAKRIATALVNRRRARPFRTSRELADAVRRAVPKGYERGRINPATRTFQALRIAVNREQENLQVFLDSLPGIAKHGTKVAVISFHSGEDRTVKTFFKRYVTEKRAVLLVKKPVTPTLAERRANPRSRSAKLRAIEFLNPTP